MLGGISPIQLVIILVIVVLIFGTKKLRGMGKDIGGAVKDFKEGMNTPDEKKDDADTASDDPELLQKKEKADADFSDTKSKAKKSKDK